MAITTLPINNEETVDITGTPVIPREREPGEKLKLDDLLETKHVNTMRNYLKLRASSGSSVDNLTDEEVRDMYMSRMRDFDTSDRGVLEESKFIYSVKDNEEKAQTAREAYELYEQVGNLFTSGSTMDTIEGVLEHTANIFNPVESPTTYLGLGVGKIAGTVAAKGAGQVAKSALKQGTVKKAFKETFKKGATAYNKNNLRNNIITATAVDATTSGLIDYIYQDASMKIGVQEDYSIFQTGLSVLSGVLGGGLELLSRTEISPRVAGYRRGTDKAIVEAGAYKDYYTASKKEQDKVKEAIIKTTRTWKEKVLDGSIILDEVKGANLSVSFLQHLIMGNTDQNIKGLGQIFKDNNLTPAYKRLKRRGRITTDILGDFIESLDDNTVKNLILELEKPNDKGQSLNFFRKIGLDRRDLSFKETLSSIISAEMSRAGQKLNLASQFDRELSNGTRLGSKVYLKEAALEQAELDRLAKGTRPNEEKLYDSKGKLIQTAESTRYFSHFQSVWKRTVVSALSTTTLNLKGFTGITVIKTAEDLAEAVLRLSIASPVALAKLARGDTKGAISEFYKVTAIAQNQVQRLRNLLDPMATARQFDAFMEVDEEGAFALNRFLSTGVEAGDNLEDIAERFSFRNPEEVILKRNKKGEVIQKNNKGEAVRISRIGTENKWFRFWEGYVDGAQKVMLVKTADTFMKSQAYMGNLDKLLRMKASKPEYNSVLKISNLNKEEMRKFLRSEEYLNLSAEAVSETQGDIFSKSYALSKKEREITSKTTLGRTVEQGRNLIGTLANFVEQFGNIPILGTILPFGRFLNNTLALTYDLAGGGALNHVFDLAKAGSVREARTIAIKPSATTIKKLKRGVVGGVGLNIAAARTEEGDDGGVKEFFEDVLRGAANYTLLGHVIKSDKEKIRKGYRWNDYETSTGDLVNIQYDFPYSQFAILARMINVKLAGQEISDDLKKEALEQIGIGQLTRNLGQAGTINRMFDQLFDGEYAKMAETASTGLLDPISTTISGIARPLDPINKLAGYAMDAEAMDARLANVTSGDTATKTMINRMVYDSTRYLNNIFELITGSQVAQSKRGIAREGDMMPQSPVADVFGFRTEAPRTYTQKALAQINVAEWRVEQRMKTMFPEGDALYKEKIQPVLEVEMEHLLTKNREFKNASPKRKEVLILRTISKVKSSIQDRMELNQLNVDPNSNKTRTFIRIRNIMKQKSKYRKQAIKEITGEDDMTIEQLKQLGQTSMGQSYLAGILDRIKQIKEGL